LHTVIDHEIADELQGDDRDDRRNIDAAQIGQKRLIGASTGSVSLKTRGDTWRRRCCGVMMLKGRASSSPPWRSIQKYISRW